MSTNPEVKYKRILIKLSGEALLGDDDFGINQNTLEWIAKEIKDLKESGVEIALVVGGGNIIRGHGLAKKGMQRVTADQMGMLATVINALAIQDALERNGMYARVMSAIKINEVCEDFIRRRAVRHLEKGRIVVLAAGTGNPFFTTDSAASLRSIEIDADLLIKATKVDGIYDSDPQLSNRAKLIDTISYDDVLTKKLNVMDATAVVLCRDNGMPLRVLNMMKKDAFLDAACGKEIGTFVSR
ncbi:MAG: UMP kinase [Pseudomonadota bacterium]|nr:UMP kinase [Pseudomonadota bacterium]